MAAAAATFSDSSPPGCAMRTDCLARPETAALTPCPSWPNTQAHGQASFASCRYSPRCELVTSSGPVMAHGVQVRSLEHGARGLHAALQRGPAQMVALEPDAALLAIGRAVLREPAQVLQQRVVARVDVLR